MRGSLSSKQDGIALILILFLISVAVLAYVLNATNTAWFAAKHENDQALILSIAKAQLIGYSLQRTGTGERPGVCLGQTTLRQQSHPPNYDGVTDGGCMDATKSNGLPQITSTANMRCLGRLPWQTIGMSIATPSQSDPNGEMPWYAVSANLLENFTCFPNLNPNVLNMVYTTYQCGSATNLPHPWLTVRDAKGNVLSSRVAFVVFYPDKPIGTQIRPVSPLAGVGSYLDTVVVPSTCVSPCVAGTYSNGDLDDDFIIPSGSTDPNNPLGSSVYANDRMIYVTIDELMAEVTKRAVVEAKSLILNYQAKNLHYPYAAPLGAVLNNNKYDGTSKNKSGSLPIDGTDACDCSPDASGKTACTCSFGPIASVSFKRVSGTAWISGTGSCNFSGSTCTCTGAGSCSRNTSSFQCLATGLCTNNVNGANTYTYQVPSYADIYSADNAGCTIVAGNAVCSGTGNFAIGLNEASWFKGNLWQDYFYYQIYDGINTMSAGSTSGIQALLIGTGAPITTSPYAIKGSAQTRPSSNLKDYLDSTENTNDDLVFDPFNKVRSSNYNDQVFKVAP